MLSPAIVGRLVDALTEPATAAPIIGYATAALLGLGVVRGLAVAAYSEAAARLGLAVVSDMRAAVFARLDSDAARALTTGDLLTRAVRDPARLRGFIDRVFIRSVTAVARSVFPTGMLFWLNPYLALWALAPIPIQHIGLQILQRRLQRVTRAAADAHAELTDAVHKHVSGEPETSAQLAPIAEHVERIEVRSQRLAAGLRAWVWLGTSAGLALAWYHGSGAVQAQTMTVGALVSFAGYAGFMYRPFRALTQVARSYQTGRASLERIAELLDAGVDTRRRG